MVDAVVDGIVAGLRVSDHLLVHILEGAHVGGVLLREAVGQVDDVVHLSLLEQCGIALAIYLHHLPAHRRQQHLILTRLHVGPYHHALACGVHLGLVHLAALGQTVLIDGVALCLVGVRVLIDQP